MTRSHRYNRRWFERWSSLNICKTNSSSWWWSIGSLRILNSRCRSKWSKWRSIWAWCRRINRKRFDSSPNRRTSNSPTWARWTTICDYKCPIRCRASNKLSGTCKSNANDSRTSTPSNPYSYKTPTLKSRSTRTRWTRCRSNMITICNTIPITATNTSMH